MLPEAMTSEELRRLIAEHGITQYQLAKELGIDRHQVWSWYHGKAKGRYSPSKVWSKVIREHFKTRSNQSA